MASKIGPQHGAGAVRLRLNALDPGKAAYDKLLGEPGADYGAGPVEGALRKTFANVNELLDRVAALEAATPPPFFP